MRWASGGFRRPVAIAVALALGGCALNTPPPASEMAAGALPNVRIPGQWTATSGPNGSITGAVADGWVTTFADAQLESLVTEALQYNLDLRVAAARVEQALGYMKLSGAPILPTVDLAGRASAGEGDSGGLKGVWILASWEVDLWGRVRYGQAGAQAQYASARADEAFARQSIAAAVARAWFLAIEAKMQRALVDEMITSSERLLSLAKDRQRVGRGDEYEVAQAEANLQTFRDSARRLEYAKEQAVRALELLVGRYPAAELQVPDRLSSMPGPVPVGLPSELLERRPDVIAAERRVANAFNRVEEARTARLPRISLTANVSSLSSELFVLKDIDNPVWALAAGLVFPIFNAGALRTQQEIRGSEQKEAIGAFAQIGIRAFGEVENALSGEFAATERATILARAISDNERALELALIRYRVGSSDLRAVLQQQIALYGVRSQLLRVEAERRVQRINVHLALGGGFAFVQTAAATP
jgi:NodT family efflux transporter outer membrane factor (OMF) lipoprotein